MEEEPEDKVYVVSWSCVIQAQSPEDAADMARDMIRNSESEVFFVDTDKGRVPIQVSDDGILVLHSVVGVE